MNISFTSSLSNAKPFVSNVRFHKPQGGRKPSLTAFSCRVGEVDQNTNLYKVLSLNSNQATFDEIKKAYRTMALQYHPDVCHPSMTQESTKMFVQLHEAYKTLSNPVLREEYDCRLSCRNFEGTFRKNVTYKQCSRVRWQQQIQELRRRSDNRMKQKVGTWGRGMRANNNHSEEK